MTLVYFNVHSFLKTVTGWLADVNWRYWHRYSSSYLVAGLTLIQTRSWISGEYTAPEMALNSCSLTHLLYNPLVLFGALYSKWSPEKNIYIYIKCWNIETPSMEFMYIGIWYKFLVFFSESWLCHMKVDRLLPLREKKRNRQRVNQPRSQFLQYCRKMLDRRKAVQREVLTSSRPQLKMEEEEKVQYPPSPSLKLLTWWCHRWEEVQW